VFEQLARLAAVAAASATIAAVTLTPQAAFADEGGVSFWLPGTFGSFSAVPQEPGWSFATIFYYTDVSAGGQLSASRQVTRGGLTANVNGNLTGNLNATGDLFVLAPSYAFEQPVLGGQLALSVTAFFGNNSTNVSAALTGAVGPFGFSVSGARGDAVTGFGDLYPQAALRWNNGNHNFMTYVTGDVPIGDYDPNRLSNLGIGHGAVDGGAGYTYFDMKNGHEFSAVAGATYNLQNAATRYQNGVDLHLDMAASQFLSEQFFVGVVGYAYDQVTPDIGALPIQGTFESRVFGAGPQVGYLFPLGKMQGYLNLKGYMEFGAMNRPEGWNAWLTFSISPAAASK
jgi:hypothetical protein